MQSTLALEGGKPIRTEPLPKELPAAHWMGQEEIDEVVKVLQAKSPFRYYGLDLQHATDRLETAFKERLGREYAVGVNSGTAALHICMAALGVGPGDEVLIQGYMWVSCLSAIVRMGAIPRLVDIDRTFTMDPQDLKSKIGPRSKAILAVNMSGCPGHIKKVREIADEAGLPLVEDCAQALGATLDGRPVGTVGDLSIFSFQLNKNITAGEGGMIVTDNEALFRRCTALQDLGYPRDENGRLDPYDRECMLWGVGARMSELTSAVLLAQLKKLDKIVEAMRRSKWSIRRRLEDIPGLEFREIVDQDGDSGPFLITIFPDPETCLKFTEALVAEGIKGEKGSTVCLPMKDWGFHWYFYNPSLLLKTSNSKDGFPWSHPANEFAKEYDYRHGTLPTCDDLAARSAILSIASVLTEQDEDDIVAAFKKVAAEVVAH